MKIVYVITTKSPIKGIQHNKLSKKSAMSNPLLGFVTDHHATSTDVEDQRERSSKKVRERVNMVVLEEGGEGMKEGISTHDTATIVSKSYKETVVGSPTGADERGKQGGRDESEGVMEEEEGVVPVEGKIEEQKVGDIDCPAFSFSIKEEQRIHQPWKQGVIVQLLGRKIGYRALENRLKQLWVRKGVIQIVDLSHDFYLVTFTSLEDQCRALTEGPWMIYDHYLVVSPWSANFDPASATVTKTAVWVRFSGLPIEYYDSRILHFIGNRIGRTVKVDKNTLLQERGKYARLCVEVDLSKPLLAMFELKGRHYKVEYEGLHLLCLACGRFDHYSGECANKPKPASNGGGVVPSVEGGGEKVGNAREGPWTVVQKTRRPRKGKEAVTENQSVAKQQQPVIQVEPVNTGSRFALLSEETPQESEHPKNNETVVNVEEENHMQSLAHHDRREKHTDKATNEIKKGSNNSSNKSQKINATQVNFKEKKGNTKGKKSDKMAELMVTKEFETFMTQHSNQVHKNMAGGNEVDVNHIADGAVTMMGITKQDPGLTATDSEPNHMSYHREPGIQESKIFNGPMLGARKQTLEEPLSTQPKNTGGGRLEQEVLMDAKDKGDMSVEECYMDRVVEGDNQDHTKSKEGSRLC
jgi:hypothetical protein